MAKMIKGKQLGLLSIATASKLAPTLAWGGSGSNSDTSMFYENARSNWMNDVGSVSIKVEGCVWATTDDNEDVGCMEDESGDGTTYWYQMAMCRRAQVAYSVYTSSSSSTSCNNGSYRGTVSFHSVKENRHSVLKSLLFSNLFATLFTVRNPRRPFRIRLYHGIIRWRNQ